MSAPACVVLDCPSLVRLQVSQVLIPHDGRLLAFIDIYPCVSGSALVRYPRSHDCQLTLAVLITLHDAVEQFIKLI